MSKEPVHEESNESQLGWEELNVNEDLALTAGSKARALSPSPSSFGHDLVRDTIWSEGWLEQLEERVLGVMIVGSCLQVLHGW